MTFTSDCTNIIITSDPAFEELFLGTYTDLDVVFTSIDDSTITETVNITALDVYVYGTLYASTFVFASLSNVSTSGLYKVEILDGTTVLDTGVFFYDCDNTILCKVFNTVKDCPDSLLYIIYLALTAPCNDCNYEETIKLYEQFCKDLSKGCTTKPDTSSYDCGCS